MQPTPNATGRPAVPAPSDQTTVARYVAGLWPEGGAIDTYLAWPPDMFALTSTIFRVTGCYRHVTSEAAVRGRGIYRQQRLERRSSEWMEWVAGVLSQGFGVLQPSAAGDAHGTDADLPRGPRGAAPTRIDPAELWPKDDAMCKAVREFLDLAEAVTLNALRAYESDDPDAASPEVERFVDTLLELHAVADEACTGFGLLHSGEPGTMLVKYLADLLLTAYGSLSSLPKHLGVVLPKMRTPQSGLTLRSLSHQVTHHVSEVEVVWRAFPWVNDREDTVNVLALPWPLQVDDAQFVDACDRFESVRYFEYRVDPAHPGGNREAEEHDERVVAAIVARIAAARQRVGRLHVVMLPELALTEAQHERLLLRLADAPASPGSPLPMIVAGVLAGRDGQQPLNEVHLSAHFAGRWYRVSQRKHHRWKLDRAQIRQYGLQGRLSTKRGYYEYAAVTQRRLSFLAPTGWLALCPLICEDLAQLEPVSEIIRGVGPTLLFAVLFDGPQIKSRWSARYAGVLADDPGTSVLTLTAAGMVERSRPADDAPAAPRGVPSHGAAQASGQPAPPGPIVGIWRDQLTGWKELHLEPRSDGFLLTLSSEWHEEFTADGRSDHHAAAVFRYEGVRALAVAEAPRADSQPADRSPSFLAQTSDSGDVAGHSAEGAVASGSHAGTSPAASESGATAASTIRKWEDLRELSAAMLALNAVLELGADYADAICTLLVGEPGRLPRNTLPAHLARALAVLADAQLRPTGAGISSGVEGAPARQPWATAELRAVSEQLRVWAERVRLQHAALGRATTDRDRFEARVQYLTTLLNHVKSDVERGHAPPTVEASAARTDVAWAEGTALPHAVLVALYARTEQFRGYRVKTHTHSTGDLDDLPGATLHAMSDLSARIEQLLADPRLAALARPRRGPPVTGEVATSGGRVSTDV